MKDAATYGINPDLYVKLLFVLAGMALLVVIRRRVFDDPEIDDTPVSSGARALAWASLVCWSGAIVAGRLIAYVGTRARSLISLDVIDAWSGACPQMRKTSAVIALVWTLLPGVTSAQDARTTIEDATKAMGAVGLTSITYSGAAATANFGQSRTISFGLASTSVRSYTRTIDFAQPASRATGATLPPAVRGGPPPQPGTLDQSITPANAGVGAATADLGHAVGLSARRGRQQRDDAVAKDRWRHSTGS